MCEKNDALILGVFSGNVDCCFSAGLLRRVLDAGRDHAYPRPFGDHAGAFW